MAILMLRPRPGASALRVGPVVAGGPGDVADRLIGAALVGQFHNTAVALREDDSVLRRRDRTRLDAPGQGGEGRGCGGDRLIHRDVADDHHIDRTLRQILCNCSLDIADPGVGDVLAAGGTSSAGRRSGSGQAGPGP